MSQYQIQRRWKDQTYVAPELVGSYRECRRHLADAYEDLRLRSDVDEVSLSARGGPEGLGSLEWWDARDTPSQLYIRRVFVNDPWAVDPSDYCAKCKVAVDVIGHRYDKNGDQFIGFSCGHEILNVDLEADG